MSPHLRNRIISNYEFEDFRIILSEDKLKNNPEYASKAFNKKPEKVKAVVKYFEETGCVIVNSKMNFNSHRKDKL